MNITLSYNFKFKSLYNKLLILNSIIVLLLTIIYINILLPKPPKAIQLPIMHYAI